MDFLTKLVTMPYFIFTIIGVVCFVGMFETVSLFVAHKYVERKNREEVRRKEEEEGMYT